MRRSAPSLYAHDEGKPPHVLVTGAAHGQIRTRVTVPVVLGASRPSEGGWLLGMEASAGAGSAAVRPGSSCDKADTEVVAQVSVCGQLCAQAVYVVNLGASLLSIATVFRETWGVFEVE